MTEGGHLHLMKHENIKLIALDMDGTLLNDEGEIPRENRLAIKEAQEQGIYVVLSTGRSIRGCGSHADSLNLNSYLVTVNGSEIWDDEKKLFDRNLVQPEDIKWMWDLSQKHGTRFWALSTEQNWMNEIPDDIHSIEWLKFGFDIDDDDVRKLIYRELEEKGIFELSNSSPQNIEVNTKGINKAKGLEKVCEQHGIRMNQVMAVGDSLNDIAMIKEAGLGIAMGNAQEIVKKAAKWVTATNNEAGVATAIRKWVLK
jgi:5-amino-6-(5-phospho-D-ribitylamino)uracil phosphatase